MSVSGKIAIAGVYEHPPFEHKVGVFAPHRYDVLKPVLTAFFDALGFHRHL